MLPPMRLWLHAPPDLLSCYPQPMANTSGAATGTHTYPLDPQSNPRRNPLDCRNRAAIRDPSAMGILYRDFGLITLVGTTHDTTLLYAATRGKQLLPKFTTRTACAEAVLCTIRPAQPTTSRGPSYHVGRCRTHKLVESLNSYGIPAFASIRYTTLGMSPIVVPRHTA